ncbi:hypothetical protein BCR33DRAFT_720371 [Rhizoclosmatium globosum]|uniref:Xylanolytic transcriptional activator regulatory domain-containing protein n=1 Tax=Rhizoclosmatium globosum TaxID=329046 RepID=A0A1Y2BYJ6_9FUNG|nr:hypothetical protein BCR33DRAFT_720371 [Rhizoclosmatium globosum]|eukprot:ORY39135.1 hypothetical protein BCR33DRAFT_720371 [Rhizoclosmatium globosum]
MSHSPPRLCPKCQRPESVVLSREQCETCSLVESEQPTLSLSAAANQWTSQSNELYMKPYIPLVPPSSLVLIESTAHLAPAGFYNRYNAHIQSMIQSTYRPSEWTMEDSDLIPTIDDWLICFHCLHIGNGELYTMMQFDSETFLKDFFHLEPFFRLSICAKFALSSEFITEAVALSYYNRARKALEHADLSQPSLQTVQGLFQIYQFIYHKGQIFLGRQIMDMGVKALLAIRLNHDPDDSPWLFHLNLTVRQKEERRRVFWAFYYYWAMAAALSPDPLSAVIAPVNMKPPGLVLDPHPIFDDRLQHRPYDCDLLVLISTLKRLYFAPPTSLHVLLSSNAFKIAHSCLDSVHKSIPQRFLLLSETAETITTQETATFIAQFLSPRLPLTSVNFRLYASVSILYRPIMFLAGLKSMHPLLLSRELRDTIATAITQCVESAYRIVNLLSLTWDIINTRKEGHFSEISEKDVWLFYPDGGGYASFEAFIVFWFALCRMQAGWWEFVGVRKPNVEILFRQMKAMHEWNKKAQMDENGVVSKQVEPQIACQEAVLDEIERLAEGKNGWNAVCEIEMGMAVLDIGTVNIRTEEVMTVEPHTFMGLLGMEIGGIRFKGRTEESWRLFWKLYS